MPRVLSVGLIGHGFMGRAHSNAWRQAPHFFELPADLRLRTICGRDRAAVQGAAKRLGWAQAASDWRQVVRDENIDLIDICTPNDTHCEIAAAAARAGKAILCEKPLARNVREAERMCDAVKAARVPNLVCHNYRRVPSVALAKRMIDRGELGRRVFHFRARYAQDWLVDPKFPLVWRLQNEHAGSGALGDLLSHVIDLARYLVGEFTDVCADAQTFVKQRPLRPGIANSPRRRVTVDDAVAVIGRFRGGGMFTIEATRFAPGRKNALSIEINGDEGSLVFDLEDLNRLKIFNVRDEPEEQGFRDIIVTEETHPYVGNWWPPGHTLGYEHAFVHTIADFVLAICRGGRALAQPDFADALKTQRVLAACARSAKLRRWIILK
jgi:predicted dehydrogenase